MKYMVERLTDGTEVLLRSVTPHVSRGLEKAVKDSLPPKPEMPVRLHETVAGTMEPLPLDKDSQEYHDWERAYRDWVIECNKIEERVEFDNWVSIIEYCVVAWRKGAGRLVSILRNIVPIAPIWKLLGMWWTTEAPKNWAPHPLETVGADDWTRRKLYIMSRILCAPYYADIKIVQRAAIDSLVGVTEEEVARQRDGFPGSGGAGQDTDRGSNTGT